MRLADLSNALMGASGGILAMLARSLTFSITAGVGFLTLFGVLSRVFTDWGALTRVGWTGPRAG